MSGFDRHVFVYGTLRRGGSNDINLREPAPRYVGRASMAGVLHDLGPYPGLVLGAPDAVASLPVLGEVYAISAALESNLDVLEGLLPTPTGEYFKRLLPVRVEVAAPGSQAAEVCELLCIVYEINPSRARTCPAVETGDWITHCAEKTRQPLLSA